MPRLPDLQRRFHITDNQSSLQNSSSGNCDETLVVDERSHLNRSTMVDQKLFQLSREFRSRTPFWSRKPKPR